MNPRNFQVSVAARLNADKTQTSETVFDPEKRAERSVRVTKEKQASQNSAGAAPVGVQANLPKAPSASGDSKQSNDSNDKKEELTNYEISSKSTTVTSQGFTVKGLSVALLINRAALAATLGDKPDQGAIDKATKEIEQLAGQAAGLDRARGDTIKVAVVDFADASKDMEPVAGPSFLEIIERQIGGILSAVAILAVGGLLILFGLKPLTAALLATPPAPAGAAAGAGARSADLRDAQRVRRRFVRSGVARERRRQSPAELRRAPRRVSGSLAGAARQRRQAEAAEARRL